jgi:hypothetical protein
MRIIAALLDIRFAFPTVQVGSGDAAAVPVLAAGKASAAVAEA